MTTTRSARSLMHKCSPSLLSRFQRIKRKTKNKKERSWYSLKSLQVMDDQMEIGQVKTITSNGGRTVNYCELLFSSTTKAQFAPSEDKTTMTFAVSDNNLSLPQLQCNINKEVLRDLIISSLFNPTMFAFYIA